MVAGKRTRSKGAVAKGKANEFLAKTKIPPKNESGMADSKLAVRSNGVEKHKKPAAKDTGRTTPLAFYIFQCTFDKIFREKNPNAPIDRAYLDAAAADKWKTLSDSDKALYVARIKKLHDHYLARRKNPRENESGKADRKLAVRSNGVEKHKKPAAKDTGWITTLFSRRTTALFFFQRAFYREFREKNPNASIDRVYLDAAAADKWKTLSDSDKAPYVARLKKGWYDQGRATTTEIVQMMGEMKM